MKGLEGIDLEGGYTLKEIHKDYKRCLNARVTP
jgi:hypothetical protein